MNNKEMSNGSVALYPIESITVIETGNKYQITAAENFTCFFYTGNISNKYSLQIVFETIDGSGTLLLYSTVNGIDYDAVLDDAEDQVEITVTGSDASTTINNQIASFGKHKLVYAKGTNSTGTISINVNQ